MLAALGCSSGTGNVANGPTITTNGLTPAQGSATAQPSTAVTATFTEPMSASSLASPATTFTLVPTQGGAAIAGTVSVADATVTFQPTARLALGTSYTARIGTAATSAAGVAINAPVTWSFTTVAPVPLSYVDLGKVACPAQVGSYQVTPAAADPSALNLSVSTVPMPTGGSLGISPALDHRKMGSGWNSWSHTYTGDLYTASSSAVSTVTLTLPDGTGAFAFFLEPNNLSAFTFTVSCTTADGGSLQETASIVGDKGATGFAFHCSTSPLSSVTILVPAGAGGFALGEFSIAAF
jgi:hypothetical protein